MTNPKGKLVFVPEGWVVVPEEPIFDMLYAASNPPPKALDASYSQMILAAPPLPDTPPVLRWERYNVFLRLMVGSKSLAKIDLRNGIYKLWVGDLSARIFDTEQEARRAAEKALGFPDDLVVDVIE